MAASVHRIFEVVRWKNLGLTLGGKAYFVKIDTFCLLENEKLDRVLKSKTHSCCPLQTNPSISDPTIFF